MTRLVRARHGLIAQKNRVEIRGFNIVDRRTTAARASLEWKAELIRDLSGEENISAAKMATLERAV